MKPTTIEIPDGKRAEWVNGVLTLVDDKPIEYKFKVGDKVRNTIVPEFRYTVKERHSTEGQAVYMLEHELGGETPLNEKYLELIPQDITERIKTFEDAAWWCKWNGKKDLLYQHSDIFFMNHASPDLIAYARLRIITAALNEGWEPTDDATGFTCYVHDRTGYVTEPGWTNCDSSNRLRFKSAELALYAAKQFADLYADFCGCKKGGNQ